MDSSRDGDPMNRSNMSVDEKKQLVHILSRDPETAFDALKEWDREEIVQVLRAEIGKKVKHKTLSNDEIINKLLKAIAEKRDPIPTASKRSLKRQRKNVQPIHFSASGSTNRTKGKDTFICKNVACQGTLRREDLFCKRCSCCICRKYDENKDPSLWLNCNSDRPFTDLSCGLSCHLECALKNERSGFKEDKPSNDVDGGFNCVACGKKNRVLECWRKQMVIVTETRSVDILCYRLVLAQKLLKGTEMYRALSEPVEEAVKSLETELHGPLADLPSAMCRGIVSRLASAPRVNDLCSSALISFQEIMRKERPLLFKMQGTTKVRFEDVHATSLSLVLGSEDEPSSSVNTIHHSVWHRKVSEQDYADIATCALVSPNTRYLVSGLTPATEYCFKVVSFSGSRQTSVEETKVSTKPSQEEEQEQQQEVEEATLVNSLSTKEEEQVLALRETVPENAVNDGNNSSGSVYSLEDCVKILRQLESSGYIERYFRQKFLTWYSFDADPHGKMVVKTFIDGFKEDPPALAGQLIDSFHKRIIEKPPANGGCSS